MRKNVLLRFNYLKKKAGFTIVESFAAIVILGLCAISLFAGLNVGLHLVNDIRENIIASSIMQEEVEELRKSFFATLPSYGTSSFSNTSLSLLYNSTGTVTAINAYSDPNIVKIVLTVTWYSRLKTTKQHTKRIATLIAKNGINSI